jgi:hypothetical protein
VLHAKIIVLDVDIHVRENELLLDVGPDNAGHFITIKINNRVLDLDTRSSGNGGDREGASSTSVVKSGKSAYNSRL